MPNELKVLDADTTAEMDAGSSANDVGAEDKSANAGNSSEVASSDKENELTTSPTVYVGAGERPPLSNTSSMSTLVPDKDDEPSVNATETEKAGTKTLPMAETAERTSESGSDDRGVDKKDGETKIQKGWDDTPPFSTRKNTDQTVQKKCVSWYELTLREKYEYRKKFLHEYFSETRACLPYVKRLFLTIIRISPWRGVVLLILNAMNAFLPALSLKAQGDFLILVLPAGCPC